MASLLLISAVTATGAGAAVAGPNVAKTYQVSGATTAGAGAATVSIQGTMNGGQSWDTIGTISLTLSTTVSSDSFSSWDRYSQIRANVTALSGTGANVAAWAGY